MEQYAKSLDPRVKMADYCIVANGESSMSMANSYGLDLSQTRNMANAFLVARVEENGVTKSGHEYWNGRDFAEFDYKVIAKKAVDIALSYLGASSMESGDFPVVFDNNNTKDLFGVFSGIFMAENGQKGFSMLTKDKIGAEIAAPHITLRDDGICDLSLGSMAFDAEGVSTQQKAIIENGVLNTLLYNTKAAAKDGVKSTGNASKGGFGGAIGTSITNFYLVPTDTSFEDLIGGIEKGVLITEMAGLHSGVNTVSGDFSVSADGFLIENGKVGRPIEQITVAGNFYTLLKNIEAVGSDLRFHSGGQGGMGMPSIRVNGLRISGL
jgi:PmbA protein